MGLLDENLQDPMTLGLLAAGTNMLGSRQGLAGSISQGLEGFLTGILQAQTLKQQQAKEDLDRRYKEAQIQHLLAGDGADETLKRAQAAYYEKRANDPYGDADPYWQTLDTPKGLFKFNVRTGEATPLQADGEALMKSASSPLQQGLITAAKQANTITEIPNSDGSVKKGWGGDLFGQGAANNHLPTVPNNNFGNLRPIGATTGFQSFATPEEGLKALSDQIGLYGSKHGINTLIGFTSTYAPKGDGNNDPVAYAQFLSKQLGVPVDQKIDLTDPFINKAMTQAVARMETGAKIPTIGQSQSTYDKTLAQGQANLAMQPQIKAAEKIAEADADAKIGLENNLANIDNMLGTLQTVKDHTGLSTGLGAKGLFLGKIPGTDAHDFQVKANQLGSQSFLSMVPQMKGMGQLSDAEGKKLQSALTTLGDVSQSQESYTKELNTAQQILNDARERLMKRGTVGTTAQKPTVNKFAGFTLERVQ